MWGRKEGREKCPAQHADIQEVQEDERAELPKDRFGAQS